MKIPFAKYHNIASVITNSVDFWILEFRARREKARTNRTIPENQRETARRAIVFAVSERERNFSGRLIRPYDPKDSKVRNKGVERLTVQNDCDGESRVVVE